MLTSSAPLKNSQPMNMCLLSSLNYSMHLKKTGRVPSNVKRLDQVLVARQLATSRTAAARHIQAGEVMVNDHTVSKPASKISDEDVVRLTVAGPQYASRDGHRWGRSSDRF